MKMFDLHQFDILLNAAPIKPRLKGELRFVKSTEGMNEQDWQERELLAIAAKSGNKGVLLLAPDDNIYMLPYEISTGITSKTGQAQPIICDFCRTWQSGTRSGSIVFPKGSRSHDKIGFLCCADLRCSLHVRGKTDAAQTSRSQLREDLVPEQRIDRLKERLQKLVADLELAPVLT